jgi:GxxExxY protein
MQTVNSNEPLVSGNDAPVNGSQGQRLDAYERCQPGRRIVFEKRQPIDELTASINGCAFRVQNTLGCGFLEKVYENALCWELAQAGHSARQQVPYKIRYGPIVAGEYVADVVVDDAVVVEIKACDAISVVHKAQAINYLKASGLRAGLVINFGHPRLEIRRVFRS